MSAMITVEEALARVLASAETPLEEEKVALRSGLRPRAGARPYGVAHPAAVPQFRHGRLRAARGGHGVGAATLTVVGKSAAGRAFEGAVGPGEAVRIFTGAPMPDGADAIVIQEDVSREGERIRLSAAAPAGENLRAAGMDFRTGETLIPRAAGSAPATSRWRRRRTTPRSRSAGARGSRSWRPATNWSRPAATLGPAQIIASNNFAVAGLVEACGGDRHRSRHRGR